VAPDHVPRRRGFRPQSPLVLALLLLPLALPPALSTGTGDNQPPVAVISSPAADQRFANDGPTTLVFDGNSSYDTDGRVVSWEWDLGDGSGRTGPVVDHTYNTSGTYLVVLTVTDDGELVSRAARRITLSPWEALSARITEPPDGALLSVNETTGFAFSLLSGPSRERTSCRWDLGDGTVTTEPAPRHSFSRPGFYMVRLSVEDIWGGRSDSSISVLVRSGSPQGPVVDWSGDTDVTGGITLAGRGILLGGNLTVSGNLSLESCELEVASRLGGAFAITVVRGGRLEIGSGTVIRPSEPSGRFFLRVLPGASLAMSGSELRGCGRYYPGPDGAYRPDELGLYLATNEATISRCRITGNAVGMVVDRGASPSISGSDISRNTGNGILVLNGSAPLVQGNVLNGNGLRAPGDAGRAAAISSRSSSPVIFNNSVQGDPASAGGRPIFGLELAGPGKPRVLSSRISGHRGSAGSAGILSISSEPVIDGNVIASNTVGLDIRGGRALVSGNTVSGKKTDGQALETAGLSDASGSRFWGNSWSGCDFGARIGSGSTSTFEGGRFLKNLYGIECRSARDSFRVRLSNCTLEGNFRDLLVSEPPQGSQTGRLTLVNCVYDPALVEISEPVSTVVVGWLVTVRVLDGRSLGPVEGAEVRLIGRGGLDAGTYLTGPDGRTYTLELESVVMASGFQHDASPYTVVASAGDLASLEWRLDLKGPTELTLLLQEDAGRVVVVSGPDLAPGTARAVAGSPLALSAVGVPERELPDLVYRWDFGDGVVGSGPEGAHIYERPGVYEVTLTVRRGDLVLTGNLTVQVRAGPARASESAVPGEFVALAFGIAILAGAAFFVGYTETGLYLLGLALMLLYSKIARARVLDNFVRGKIYGYILANPGDHYNSIMDALKLSNGTFAYHIRMLEREQLIKSQADGVYKRFYPADMIMPDPDHLELTRIQRVICDIIAERPGINQREVAALLNLSSATINYHIETLIKKHQVRRERVGMKVRYYPVPTGKSPSDGQLASMLTPPL